MERGSDNETVLGSSRKLRAAVENLIDGSEKRICWLSFDKTASKFQKEILKIGPRIVHVPLEYAECNYLTLVFVTLS